MWIYNVGHTRFSEFRNVSANIFLIFTRLWTKLVVSIKGGPNGKFNGYPSISCNSPGTWVIDGPAFYSRSWFICPDFLSQLIMSYYDEWRKAVFLKSNQFQIADKYDTHNSTSYVSVASNYSSNGLQISC